MKITADGLYRINNKHSARTSIVYLSGVDGGAVFTLGYYDDYGNFIPLTSGIISVDTQSRVEHGFNIALILQVSGASGTTETSLVVTGHD